MLHVLGDRKARARCSSWIASGKSASVLLPVRVHAFTNSPSSSVHRRSRRSCRAEVNAGLPSTQTMPPVMYSQPLSPMPTYYGNRPGYARRNVRPRGPAAYRRRCDVGSRPQAGVADNAGFMTEEGGTYRWSQWRSKPHRARYRHSRWHRRQI